MATPFLIAFSMYYATVTYLSHNCFLPKATRAKHKVDHLMKLLSVDHIIKFPTNNYLEAAKYREGIHTQEINISDVAAIAVIFSHRHNINCHRNSRRDLSRQNFGYGHVICICRTWNISFYTVGPMAYVAYKLTKHHHWNCFNYWYCSHIDTWMLDSIGYYVCTIYLAIFYHPQNKKQRALCHVLRCHVGGKHH